MSRSWRNLVMRIALARGAEYEAAKAVKGCSTCHGFTTDCCPRPQWRNKVRIVSSRPLKFKPYAKAAAPEIKC